MNKLTTLLTAVLLLTNQTGLFAVEGQQKESSFTLSTPENNPALPAFSPGFIPVNEMHDPEREPETPFRRAEIIFFISYPFILAIHYGIFAGFSYLSNPATNLSLDKLSGEVITWMFVSSAVGSGAIAWADYERRRLIEAQNPQGIKEAGFQLQMSHRF